MTKNHKTIEYPFYQELGKAFTKIRHKKRLTLEKVAKALNTTKVTIDNWELGNVRISNENFKKLCEYYKIDPDYQLNIKIEFRRKI